MKNWRIVNEIDECVQIARYLFIYLEKLWQWNYFHLACLCVSMQMESLYLFSNLQWTKTKAFNENDKYKQKKN